VHSSLRQLGIAACATLALVLWAACDRPRAGSIDVDALPVLSLTEDLRVGSVEDPELGFSRVGGITVDREGRVYVLELTDRQVRVFGADGTRLHVIGRSGEGPGEFQSADLRIGFVGDTLWVNDRSSGRISLFQPDGSLLRTIVVEALVADAPPGFGISLYPGTLRGDGMIASSSRIFVPPGEQPPGFQLQVPTVRLDQTGKIVDTIRLRPVRMAPPSRVAIVDGVPLSLPPLPASDPLMLDGTDSDHLYVVDRAVPTEEGDAYFTVTKVAQRADTVFRKEFRYEPQPFTDAYLERLLTPVAAQYAGAIRQSQPATDSAAAAAVGMVTLRDVLAAPPFVPPVSQARAEHDGSIWLRREDQGGPAVRWLVLGAAGDPVGQVDLPRDATMHWSDGEVIWASVPDELGVPWVVRYRIGAARP
jgi:hypothetical protein